MVLPIQYGPYNPPKMAETPLITPVTGKGNVKDNPHKNKNDYKKAYTSGGKSVDKDGNYKPSYDSVTISDEGRLLYQEMMKKKQNNSK